MRCRRSCRRRCPGLSEGSALPFGGSAEERLRCRQPVQRGGLGGGGRDASSGTGAGAAASSSGGALASFDQLCSL